MCFAACASLRKRLLVENSPRSVLSRSADLYVKCSVSPVSALGVAKLAIVDMRKQLDAGIGRTVFADYIVCIERYLIPFLGAQSVTLIDYDKIQAFYEWGREKMGREPKASTLNTHNSAISRVFEEAVAQGFIAHNSVPLMINRGEKSERRHAAPRRSAEPQVEACEAV